MLNDPGPSLTAPMPFHGRCHGLRSSPASWPGTAFG